MKFKCPTCGELLKNDSAISGEIADSASRSLPKYFPFCSERCKMLDFGAWLDEDYKIQAVEDDTDADTPDNL